MEMPDALSWHAIMSRVPPCAVTPRSDLQSDVGSASPGDDQVGLTLAVRAVVGQPCEELGQGLHWLRSGYWGSSASCFFSLPLYMYTDKSLST